MADKKLIGAIIAVAIIAVAVFAITNVTAEDDAVVHIGYLPSDHDAALFVANASGMYEKEGIKVELHEYNNGGDLMSAMASGDLDVGYVGITPAVSSITKGVPVKIISAAQTEGSGLVAHDSSVTSIKDLKGKKVATPGEASIQDVLLKYDLKKNGLQPTDVEAPGMKVASMNDALKTGSLDAIMTFEPYVSISTKVNGQHLIEKSGDIIPNHPCCVVVASEKFLNDHSEQAKKILDIHKEATQQLIDNPNDQIQYFPSHIIVDEEAEKESLSNIKFVSGLDDDYKSNVEEFLNIEVDLGVIDSVPSADKLYATL